MRSADVPVASRAPLTRPQISITVADAVCNTVEVCRCARYTRYALGLTCILQGVRTQLPSLFVRGRLVRYIHLPEALDPGRAIESHRKKLVDASLHYARKGAGARPRPAAGGTASTAHAGAEGAADSNPDDTQDCS